MTVLTRFITGRMAFFSLLSVLVLVAISLSFELLEEADNVLAAADGDVSAVFSYALLRVPDIASKMLPIAAMLAALITCGLMIRHNEFVALWSSGISALTILSTFLPIAAVLSVLQFVLDDFLVPDTLGRLYAWNVGDFRRSGLLSSDLEEVWLLSGNDIVSLPLRSARLGHLETVTIFIRDGDGVLIDQLQAATAQPVGDGWLLRDVNRYSAAAAHSEHLAEYLWRGHIDFDNLPLISGGLRELTLGEILTLIRNEGFGQRPPSMATTWAHVRVAGVFSPLLIIFLVVSAAQFYRRGSTFTVLLLLCFAAGFSYFILDNVGLALGEAGFLPPWLAGWSAKIVLLCTIGSLLTRNEA
jgi:lipopolysaccharide export system permease protein